MFRLLWPLAYIFAWRWYYRKIILARYPDLEKELEKERKWKKISPSLYPLLLGVIQPADFVLEWAGKERKPIERESSYNLFKEKQNSFEYVALKESVELQVDLKIVADRHTLITIIIVFFTLVAISIQPLSLILYPANNLLASLSELAFISILLVPAILGLFAYGQLLKATHEHKEDLELKLTRLSAARHAFNTLEQVEVIQQRLYQKEELEVESGEPQQSRGPWAPQGEL